MSSLLVLEILDISVGSFVVTSVEFLDAEQTKKVSSIPTEAERDRALTLSNMHLSMVSSNIFNVDWSTCFESTTNSKSSPSSASDSSSSSS